MDFLTKNPLISHAALAALYSGLILSVLLLFKVSPYHACLAAFIIVSVFFYGREAGQGEHDRKSLGEPALASWYKATLFFFWQPYVILQWIVPVFSSFVVCFAVYKILS